MCKSVDQTCLLRQVLLRRHVLTGCAENGSLDWELLEILVFMQAVRL